MELTMSDKRIYLTTNTDNREPEILAESSYIHVKCKSNGTQTVVITDCEVISDCCTEMTQTDAQALLDSWIDEENAAPPPSDGSVAMPQNRIDLGAFLN